MRSMTRGMVGRALLTAVLLMLPVRAHAQVRVLHETFASVPTNPAFFTTKCPPVMVGGEPAAECNWNGTLHWQDPNKLVDMGVAAPGTGPMLFRVEVLLDPDIDIKDGSKLFRFGNIGTVNWDFFVTCQFFKGTSPGGADILISDGDRTMWGRDGSWRPLNNVDCYQRGVWYQLAVYVDATTVRFFWRGQLIQEFPAVAGKPYPLTGDGRKFYMPSNWSSNPGWEHDASNRTRWRKLEIFSQSGAGDPATGSLRDNTVMAGGSAPRVNCTGVWADSLSEPTPLVCDATQVQTRTRTRTFTVTTPESNGGTCVERDQSPIRLAEQAPCVYVPPPPPPVPTLVGRFASQATYSSSGVSGLRVTLRVSAAQPLPAIDSAVTLRVPLANGASELRSGRVRSTKANAYSGGDGQIVVEMPGLNAIGLELQLPQ